MKQNFHHSVLLLVCKVAIDQIVCIDWTIPVDSAVQTHRVKFAFNGNKGASKEDKKKSSHASYGEMVIVKFKAKASCQRQLISSGLVSATIFLAETQSST